MALLPWGNPWLERGPWSDHPIPIDEVDLDLDEDVVWVISGCDAHALSIAYIDDLGLTHIRFHTESGSEIVVADRSRR